MSTLPKGWTEVALGDVASFVRGVTFKPADVVQLGTPGSTAVMRTSNVQAQLDLRDVWAIPAALVKRPEQLLRPGDILISSANSWNLVGKCSWIGELAWPSSFGGFVTVLRCDEQRVDPRFLYRWFSSDRTQATVRSFGRSTTNISNLDLNRCRAMVLPLPPLDEQRRIAAILDKADELRAKRRAALDQLDSLTQAIFLDMFGDPVTNSRGWDEERFGAVCDTRLGKMLDKKQQNGRDPRRYLRNANVRWFGFDLSDLAEMDFDEKDRLEFQLLPGDLLICEGGQPGRAAVWKDPGQEIYFQKAVHRGRVRPGVVTAEYLMWLLWFLSTSGKLSDHTSSSTIAHLTGQKLKAMRIPVPDYSAQEAFSRVLQRMENQKQLAEQAVKALDELFASLQSRAFRGEL